MSFELERFEWAAGERLELSGRWFGVRGRRFLRPTLELDVAGQTQRLLATLEHKPWAPEEGDEWVAAFEWTGGPAEIESVRLVVGPDATVELSPPRGSANGRPRSGARGDGGGRRKLAEARAEVKRVRAELERERDAALAERDKLAAELGAANEELATELAAAKDEFEEARLRIEALESGLRVATRLRDDARAERNAALEARDAAVESRDAALESRHATLKPRDAVLRSSDAAVAEPGSLAAESVPAAHLVSAAPSLTAAATAAPSAPPARQAAPPPRHAAPTAGGVVSPPRRTVAPDLRETRAISTPAERAGTFPAAPTPGLADSAHARFLSYPIRPRAGAAAKVRWAARVMAVLSLLLFVAALIALIA